MSEKIIEIRAIAKPSDRYMRVTAGDGIEYLVFDKSIHPHLEQRNEDGTYKLLGTKIDADIELDVEKKDKSGTYNLIRSITVEGKVIGGKERRGFAPSRGRDEDRTDIRSALITIKDLWVSGKLKDENPLVTWLLAELLVIATGKREAKGETTKTDNTDKTIDQQQGKKRASGPASGKALALLPGETERVRGFFDWLGEHDILDPRLFLEVDYGIPQGEALSDKKVVALFRTIKTKMGW